MIQHHQSSTSTAFYWPSIWKNINWQIFALQPDTEYFLPLLPYTDLVPPSTDPVPPSTIQYHSILTQYHQVSTSTNLYCCCLGITDSCTVYPWSCFDCCCAQKKSSHLDASMAVDAKMSFLHRAFFVLMLWCFAAFSPRLIGIISFSCLAVVCALTKLPGF